MKRSELKQIIREVIEEAKVVGPLGPTDDINELERRLSSVFNMKDYTETWLRYIRPFFGPNRSQYIYNFARELGINPFDLLTKGIVKELYENDQIDKDTFSKLSRYDADDEFKKIVNYMDYDKLIDGIIKLGSKLPKDFLARRILAAAWNRESDGYDRNLTMRDYVQDNLKKIYSNMTAVHQSKGRGYLTSLHGPKDPNSEFRQLVGQINSEIKADVDTTPWKDSVRTQEISDYITTAEQAGKLKRFPKKRERRYDY